MRKLFGLLALVLTSTCAVPQLAAAQQPAPPPVRSLAYSPSVKKVLDSLREAGLREGIESAKCVIGYAVSRDTLALDQLGPASIARAVRDTIWALGRLCPPGVPTLHTHLVFLDISPLPSDIDLDSERRNGVWGLILNITSVGWFVTLY